MSLLDLAGKRGLVVGIANANSIAYGCAKAFHAAGAELAITYLNDVENRTFDEINRINRELGSLVAALGGIDVLVFTAGIGEHAAPVTARVCDNAAWLGIRLDAAANLADGPRISTAHSPVPVWVVPTNEELMIARHTLARTCR